MGNNKDIDIRIIKKYLMTEKDELKLKSFLRLYSNYSKLANFNQNQLESFENEIYTIGNRSLSDKEKIKKEIIPINMFEFEDNTYVLAFCKLRGSIRHFTLSKILNIKEI